MLDEKTLETICEARALAREFTRTQENLLEVLQATAEAYDKIKPGNSKTDVAAEFVKALKFYDELANKCQGRSQVSVDVIENTTGEKKTKTIIVPFATIEENLIKKTRNEYVKIINALLAIELPMDEAARIVNTSMMEIGDMIERETKRLNKETKEKIEIAKKLEGKTNSHSMEKELSDRNKKMESIASKLALVAAKKMCDDEEFRKKLTSQMQEKGLDKNKMENLFNILEDEESREKFRNFLEIFQ